MRKIRKVRSNHNDLFNYFIYDEKCLSKKYVSKCVLFLDNLNKKKVGRKKKDNSVNRCLSLLREKRVIKRNSNYNILIRKNIPVFSGFGGGSSNAMFGSSGSSNPLVKVTAIVSAIFLILSLSITYLSRSSVEELGIDIPALEEEGILPDNNQD